MARPQRHFILPDTQGCTKCGVDKPMSDYGMRHDRGQPYRQCRECMAARKWAKKNPERHRQSHREWVARDPDRARAIWREMTARRRQDPQYMLVNRIRCGLSRTLTRGRKEAATFELLGYTADELRAHLERQFLRGMSWENMGEWHIDHIVPLSSFTITGPNDPELRRAWALTNLRPLWAKDNMSKGAKREVLI